MQRVLDVKQEFCTVSSLGTSLSLKDLLNDLYVLPPIAINKHGSEEKFRPHEIFLFFYNKNYSGSYVSVDARYIHTTVPHYIAIYFFHHCLTITGDSRYSLVLNLIQICFLYF